MRNVSHPTQTDSLKPGVHIIPTMAQKVLSDETTQRWNALNSLSGSDNHDRWDRKNVFLAIAEILAWIEWKRADIAIRCDWWTIVAIADIS